MKKRFGQLDLTWNKLILFAVIAGVYTGVMALLPFAKDTSFADISITFEWWVLFGILIIVNSKSPLDAGLKCFVFFLISQPLVYLVQVPFSSLGWGIFRYYPGWFLWTLCTFPMGFVGWYMKKEAWWSLLILVPMLAFVGYHYMGFFREALSFFPQHLLSAVFCAVTVILYPLCIFGKKGLRLAGLAVALLILAVMTVLVLTGARSSYNTTLLLESEDRQLSFDDSWTAELEDPSFGEVSFHYEEAVACWAVEAKLVRQGDTRLILTAPDGTRRVFDLTVERSSYHIEEISPDPGGTGGGGESGEETERTT